MILNIFSLVSDKHPQACPVRTIDGQTGVHVLCLRATALGDQRMCMIVDDANKQKAVHIGCASHL